MSDFREALDECGFADLGYVQKFTWCKRLVGGITVWERLDRVVADSEWIYLFFSGTKVIHLDVVSWTISQLLFIQMVYKSKNKNLGDLNRYVWTPHFVPFTTRVPVPQ